MLLVLAIIAVPALTKAPGTGSGIFGKNWGLGLWDGITIVQLSNLETGIIFDSLLSFALPSKSFSLPSHIPQVCLLLSISSAIILGQEMSWIH